MRAEAAGLSGPPAQSSDRCGLESDHAAAGLVPELHARAFQAAQEREARRALQDRARFERGAQPIVRNMRREVMDVVITDVAGEPVRHARQIVVGAARDRGLAVVPALLPRPVRFLEY